MSQEFLDLMSHRRIDSLRVGTEARTGLYRVIPTANHWGLWQGETFIGQISRPGHATLIAKLLNDHAAKERP